MSFLFRKFTRQKWDTKPSDVTLSELQADALTSCLRTSSNNLSLWESDNDVYTQNEDILTALFTAGKDAPERTDIVVVRKGDLEPRFEVRLVQELGVSAAIETVNSKHVNLTGLNYASISQFAESMIAKINSVKKLESECAGEELPENRCVRRFSRQEVIAIVKRQLELGNVDQEKLSEKWKSALGIDKK